MFGNRLGCEPMMSSLLGMLMLETAVSTPRLREDLRSGRVRPTAETELVRGQHFIKKRNSSPRMRYRI